MLSNTTSILAGESGDETIVPMINQITERQQQVEQLRHQLDLSNKNLDSKLIKSNQASADSIQLLTDDGTITQVKNRMSILSCQNCKDTFGANHIVRFGVLSETQELEVMESPRGTLLNLVTNSNLQCPTFATIQFGRAIAQRDAGLDVNGSGLGWKTVPEPDPRYMPDAGESQIAVELGDKASEANDMTLGSEDILEHEDDEIVESDYEESDTDDVTLGSEDTIDHEDAELGSKAGTEDPNTDDDHKVDELDSSTMDSLNGSILDGSPATADDDEEVDELDRGTENSEDAPVRDGSHLVVDDELVRDVEMTDKNGSPTPNLMKMKKYTTTYRWKEPTLRLVPRGHAES
ncbi:hypothetical protein KEM48_013019 [Puccinia striiformis f. sp. tritici PST-130]|nr:hypothetical protein KEM48_013019 [Puccinia striiformis f. sp. tritici PST-130]